jgi:hypothetical protein
VWRQERYSMDKVGRLAQLTCVAHLDGKFSLKESFG